MPTKKAKKCKHLTIYPTNDSLSLRHDTLVGWVVDVICAECGRLGVTQVNSKKVDWDEE